MIRMSNQVFGEILSERLLAVKGDINTVWVPEKKFSEMTINEIRKYVTFFVDLGYQSLVKMPYEDKRKIIEKMNKEWDRRAGDDFTKIYNHLDKIKNTEKWNGEERYKFFSYSHKGLSEFAVLKQAKAILNFLYEKGIDVDDALALFQLSGKFFYWDMTNEQEDCHYMDSINKRCQDEFVNYVLNEINDDEARKKDWFNERFLLLPRINKAI